MWFHADQSRGGRQGQTPTWSFLEPALQQKSSCVETEVISLRVPLSRISGRPLLVRLSITSTFALAPIPIRARSTGGLSIVWQGVSNQRLVSIRLSGMMINNPVDITEQIHARTWSPGDSDDNRETAAQGGLGAAAGNRVGLGLPRTPIPGRFACRTMAGRLGSTQTGSIENRRVKAAAWSGGGAGLHQGSSREEKKLDLSGT